MKHFDDRAGTFLAERKYVVYTQPLVLSAVILTAGNEPNAPRAIVEPNPRYFTYWEFAHVASCWSVERRCPFAAPGLRRLCPRPGDLPHACRGRYRRQHFFDRRLR